jgi:hypothetical protein
MQMAVDFYTSADGETSPYLSELRVIYSAAEPPPPPVHVAAVAKDGAVELSWKASPSRDVNGYMVYYGTSRGEYFGDHAILGSTVRLSPIDVGNRSSVRIDGLTNGTLYYFAVAAYDKPGTQDRGAQVVLPEPGRQIVEPDRVMQPGRQVTQSGEFSREVAARPLRMAE